jgi:hypothetical protein
MEARLEVGRKTGECQYDLLRTCEKKTDAVSQVLALLAFWGVWLHYTRWDVPRFVRMRTVYHILFFPYGLVLSSNQNRDLHI